MVEDEFLTGIVMFTSLALIHKLYGKDIAAYIDKEIDQEEEEQSRGMKEYRKSIDDSIEGTRTS